MSYKEIMNKIRQSKGRIAKVEESLASEKRNHDELIIELQKHISNEAGTTVTITRTVVELNPNYDREALLERVLGLRMVNTSFTSIARILNREGHRTLHGKEFNSMAVSALFKTALVRKHKEAAA
jgi:hypothetical protein